MNEQAPVTFETVCAIALAFPGVEEGMSYGTRALRVRNKFMARLREDGETLVVKISEAEREFRLMVDPESFFITDHYRNYPAVLVRLARIDPDDLSDVIEQSWRWLAPRRLVAEYERTHPGQPINLLRDEEG